jgi:hypothetical protein
MHSYLGMSEVPGRYNRQKKDFSSPTEIYNVSNLFLATQLSAYRIDLTYGTIVSFYCRSSGTFT